MAEYDDYDYDDDLEDDDIDAEDMDQDADFEDYEDSDGGTPDTSTDEGLIESIRQLLAAKRGVQLPDDIDPESFLRDLKGALTAHPGIELVDDYGGSGDAALDFEQSGSDENAGYNGQGMGARRGLSHRRRKLSSAHTPTPKGQRMTPARARQVTAEFLHNTDMSEPERDRVARAKRLSHTRKPGRITSEGAQEVIEEFCKNTGLI